MGATRSRIRLSPEIGDIFKIFCIRVQTPCDSESIAQNVNLRSSADTRQIQYYTGTSTRDIYRFTSHHRPRFHSYSGHIPGRYIPSGARTFSMTLRSVLISAAPCAGCRPPSSTSDRRPLLARGAWGARKVRTAAGSAPACCCCPACSRSSCPGPGHRRAVGRCRCPTCSARQPPWPPGRRPLQAQAGRGALALALAERCFQEPEPEPEREPEGCLRPMADA
jgi:hypothetical protein